ncbi:MAG: hypothetical protein L6V78_01220 [Clostridium sp.]|nr:MAG: hypothetical protein L6V78_01220 [Clostridium sp.]
MNFLLSVGSLRYTPAYIINLIYGDKKKILKISCLKELIVIHLTKEGIIKK